MVWRHLATIDGGLLWAWNSIKPLNESGALVAAATDLRTNAAMPVPDKWSASLIREAGVDEQDETVLRAVLANYDQTNPENLIAFTALMRRLRGDTGTTGPMARMSRRAGLDRGRH